MAMSAELALRLASALTHPGFATELINQLNSPSVTNLTLSGLLFESSADALTAFAGGGQASATPLTKLINRVTVVASAADSVKLPTATPGLVLTVINAHATNSMNVFPSTGDAINALAANAAFAVAATKVCNFYCTVAGIWHSQLGA